MVDVGHEAYVGRKRCEIKVGKTKIPYADTKISVTEQESMNEGAN